MRIFAILALVFAGCGSRSRNTRPSLESASRNTQPSLESAKRSVAIFHTVLAEKRLLYESTSKVEQMACPPRRFSLNGTEYWFQSDPFANGFGTSLYLTSDKTLVVKVMESDNLLEWLWREAAAAAALNDLIVAKNLPSPQLHQPTYNPAEVSRLCQLRMVTMDRAGMFNLDRLVNTYGYQSPADVRKMAIVSLDTLEHVHSRGLLHGDIHAGNFVIEPLGDSRVRLSLIDFGRARPYRDAHTGDHVSYGPTSPADHPSFIVLNAGVLSIFELEEIRMSRRDDLFRLAEMLVFLLEGDDSLYDGGEKIIVDRQAALQRKLYRKFSDRVPPEFVAFYRTTMRMGFAQDPDYEALRATFS